MAVTPKLLAHHVERRYCGTHGHHDVTIELWGALGVVITREEGDCTKQLAYGFVG